MSGSFLVLTFPLSDINIVFPGLLWLLFSYYFFPFHRLYVFLNLKWFSHRQLIVQSFLSNWFKFTELLLCCFNSTTLLFAFRFSFSLFFNLFFINSVYNYFVSFFISSRNLRKPLSNSWLTAKLAKKRKWWLKMKKNTDFTELFPENKNNKNNNNKYCEEGRIWFLDVIPYIIQNV